METCHACWRKSGVRCDICRRPLCAIHGKRELGNLGNIISFLCDWCDIVEDSELRLLRMTRSRPFRYRERGPSNANDRQQKWEAKIEAEVMFMMHGNARSATVAGRPIPWRRKAKKIRCIICTYWYERWEVRWVDGRPVCSECWEESDHLQPRVPSPDWPDTWRLTTCLLYTSPSPRDS